MGAAQAAPSAGLAVLAAMGGACHTTAALREAAEAVPLSNSAKD